MREDCARPSAAATAAEGQQCLRDTVPRLRHLSSYVFSSLGCSACGSGGGGRLAHKLRRLVRLLQPYVARGAPAVEPARPGVLASVRGNGPCAECMLLELLSQLDRAASPLPSAPLYEAVETVYQAYANEVFKATGAPGKHACQAWDT